VSVKKFVKDPEAVLDYTLDWTAWLPSGDRIVALTASPETGIVVDSSNFTDTDTTVWVSGGTAGSSYDVTFHITTDGGREDDRSITLKITEK
jgi:hypothetical protein